MFLYYTGKRKKKQIKYKKKKKNEQPFLFSVRVTEWSSQLKKFEFPGKYNFGQCQSFRCLYKKLVVLISRSANEYNGREALLGQ